MTKLKDAIDEIAALEEDGQAPFDESGPGEVYNEQLIDAAELRKAANAIRGLVEHAPKFKPDGTQHLSDEAVALYVVASEIGRLRRAIVNALRFTEPPNPNQGVKSP